MGYFRHEVHPQATANVLNIFFILKLFHWFLSLVQAWNSAWGREHSSWNICLRLLNDISKFLTQGLEAYFLKGFHKKSIFPMWNVKIYTSVCLTHHQCDTICLVLNLDQYEQNSLWLNVFQLNVNWGCVNRSKVLL